MKILISTDIEGVAGVFAIEQTRAGNPEYERARRWMTAEANAAIEGAFMGGAQAVWVNDSHGGFRNLLPDGRCACACRPRQAAHARDDDGPRAAARSRVHDRLSREIADARRARAHDQQLCVHAGLAERRRLGEAGCTVRWRATARTSRWPRATTFAEETQPLFPDAHFETVKTAGGASSGDTLTPAASCARIAAAAREAVARTVGRRARRRHRPAPAACTLRVQTAALADLFCVLPSLERVDAVTLRFDGPSVEHVVRTLNSLSAMSFMLR